MKQKWLASISASLGERGVNVKPSTTHLGSFKAIFGFPRYGMLPYTINGDKTQSKNLSENEKEKAKAALSRCRDNLHLFKNTRQTIIRYVPPIDVSFGIGCIMFENSFNMTRYLFFALSTGSDEYLTNLSAGIKNKHHLFTHFSNWFDFTLMGVSTKDYILREGMNVNMAEEWDKIMLRYDHEVRITWD